MLYDELFFMLHVCWWFMAFLVRPGHNCLTCVLVSGWLWWMDGCQHRSVSPPCVLLCLNTSPHFLHSRSSSGLTALYRLCLGLSGFPKSPGGFFRASPYFFSFTPIAFFSGVSAFDSAEATCGRWGDKNETVREEKRFCSCLLVSEKDKKKNFTSMVVWC